MREVNPDVMVCERAAFIAEFSIRDWCLNALRQVDRGDHLVPKTCYYYHQASGGGDRRRIKLFCLRNVHLRCTFAVDKP